MQTLKIHYSKKEAFNLVKKAAYKIGLGLENESISKGILDLSHSGNFFSFGNKIEVRISNSEKSNILIEVSSRSTAMIQVVDWGTNKEIEQQLIQEIKKEI